MKISLADIPSKKIAVALSVLGVGLLVVLIVGFLRPRPPVIPTVAATSPASGQENFLALEPLVVSFQNELSPEEQGRIYFQFEPEAFFTLRWISSDQVEIALAGRLDLSTSYTLRVLFNDDPIHTISFSTPNITEEELAQDIAEQAEGDELFAEAQTEWHKNNPWYSQLPIITGDFTIVYEPDTKKFRIRLTLGESPTGAEINAAKNKALESLEVAGVTLDQYEYYVLVD